jgi:tetratricopeptide (TPR) repeat protein
MKGEHVMKTKTIDQAIAPYATQGILLAFRGKYREATHLLAHALQGEPCSAELLCAMASLQGQMNNYSFAMEYYRRAAEISPAMPEIYLGRALLHLEMEMLSLARADIKRAERILNRDSRVHLLKSQYHFQMGLIEMARAECLLALELDPESESGLLMLAQIHERRGRWEDAVDIYEHILRRIDPASEIAQQRRIRLISRFAA